MKKFCESLRVCANDTIDFEKKKVLPLRKKELKSHQDGTERYICRNIFIKISKKIKTTEKIETNAIIW